MTPQSFAEGKEVRKGEVLFEIDPRPYQAELARVRDDAFWRRLGGSDLAYLRQTIAPILRAQSDADFKALRFETGVVELGTALLARNQDAAAALKDAIVEQVSELPLGVNLVAGGMTAAELARARELETVKYGCQSWNLSGNVTP